MFGTINQGLCAKIRDFMTKEECFKVFINLFFLSVLKDAPSEKHIWRCLSLTPMYKTVAWIVDENENKHQLSFVCMEPKASCQADDDLQVRCITSSYMCVRIVQYYTAIECLKTLRKHTYSNI